MEAKLTKHVYNTRRVNLEHLLKQTQDQITEANRTNGESLQKSSFDETSEAWNALHDKVIELYGQISDLDDQWNTRNWSSQDWQQWSLISRNVD